MSDDHTVGSSATEVTVKVAVTCRAEVYDQQAAQRRASLSFAQETSAMLGANYAMVGQVRTTLVGVTVIETKRGTLALFIEVEGVWVYQWNTARLGMLAKQIAGTQKQEALARLLREEGVQTAGMHLTGSEQTKLPADPSRIIITVASG